MAPHAATLPQAASHARKSERAAVRSLPTEERVSVLEAQWDTLTPNLAKKADISDLRSDIIKWGAGAGIALFAAFAAMFIANTARIDRLDGKIDASVAKLDAKLEQSVASLNTRIDKLEARIDRLDEKIDSRFDALLLRQDKLDAKFDALMAELRAQRRGE